MIKLTSKWRKLVTEQLVRSHKRPSRTAWVSPQMMIGSIQVETMYDQGVDKISEKVLHRVAKKIRERPHGTLYTVPNPYESKPVIVMPRAAIAASVGSKPKTRQQVVAEVLGVKEDLRKLEANVRHSSQRMNDTFNTGDKV